MRLQVCVCGAVSFAIPGADVLANITPKDVVPGLRTELLRNSALEFDRQIRNTTLRIQNVGFQKRLRWTSLQAAGARPAMVRPRMVVFQGNGQDEFPQQQPGAEPGIQQAGIFAEPSQASIFSVDTLYDRSGIYVQLAHHGRWQ